MGDATIKRIAVVAPMLNEARHLETLGLDLARQDFDGDVAYFVADGGSGDGSPELLAAVAERHGLDLTLLDNPKRSPAAGLNVCIRAALERTPGPDLVVRIDCHAHYPADYLSACARLSEETGAWNVGGYVVPRGMSPGQRAAACALTSPFGGANWTRHRRRHDADTVFCGAFRPEVFERVGLFDESLPVAEAEDFNLRIRQAGGRVVCEPSIVVGYLPRDSVRRAFTQYYRYGLWKAAATAKHRQLLSLRSAVPLGFVLSAGALALAARRSRGARRLLALESGAYMAAATAASVGAVVSSNEELALVPRVLAYFPTYHLAHGLGGVHGWLRVARRALTRR